MLTKLLMFFYHAYAGFAIFLQLRDNDEYDNIFLPQSHGDEKPSHLQGGIFTLEHETSS